jgi:hypothetical protein
MSDAAIITESKGTTIGLIKLSAAISIVHTRTADIVEHPVERGSDLADDRRKKQAIVTIDGIISEALIRSDLKIDEDGFVTRDNTIAIEKSVQDAYVDLKALFDKNETFTLATSLEVYENMMFSSFVVNQDKNTGSILSFKAECKQVSFADSQIVPVKPSEKKRATSKKDKGKSTAGDAPDGPRQTSLRKLGGLISKDPGASLKTFLNGG